MAQIITMPRLSDTMTEGVVATWLKKVGDTIKTGDILAEIETDKAQMDFECQEEGFLAKILMEAGSKEVSVNKVCCYCRSCQLVDIILADCNFG